MDLWQSRAPRCKQATERAVSTSWGRERRRSELVSSWSVVGEVWADPDASTLPSRFGLAFRDYVVFNDLEHLAETCPVQLELRNIVLDAESDLVDLDEKSELTLAESIKEFGIVVSHGEDRLTIGDESDL